LRGFRQLIEKTYRSLPTEILHLRPRSYGRLYVYLAWKSMDSKDYKQAFHYTQQAFALYPQQISQLWYLRLYVAIAVIRLLGAKRYDQVRSFNHNIRRRLLARAT
ncbi:MAG: glycosyltransferase family 2 protein, partial [Brasilonema sp.]